jgi:hypothetical protein
LSEGSASGKGSVGRGTGYTLESITEPHQGNASYGPTRAVSLALVDFLRMLGALFNGLKLPK